MMAIRGHLALILLLLPWLDGQPVAAEVVGDQHPCGVIQHEVYPIALRYRHAVWSVLTQLPTHVELAPVPETAIPASVLTHRSPATGRTGAHQLSVLMSFQI